MGTTSLQFVKEDKRTMVHLITVTVRQKVYGIVVILVFRSSSTGVRYTWSLTYPHRKKSKGVLSADLLEGQAVSPSLQIQLCGECLVPDIPHTQRPMWWCTL
ncbi:hypothetical protein PR048_011376 [Dryococelus australis]|uniref:Uncharacterized protein n=1 Tax=Dryococelus australis TaxID=614101 RepID=A0ABQ9HLE0_9NEOP|nr:hypothetical protein PR048_011376 [Dryococelus australis]